MTPTPEEENVATQSCDNAGGGERRNSHVTPTLEDRNIATRFFFFFEHLIVFCTSYCFLHILLFAHLIVLHFLFHCTFYSYFSFLPYICSCCHESGCHSLHLLHHTTAAHHLWTASPIMHCTHTFPSTITPITQLSPFTH